MRLFFLGAGCSKPIGLPITSELLPKIIEAARNDTLFAGDPLADIKRKGFLELLHGLVPGLVKTEKLPSIVDLLSLVDFALAEGFTMYSTGGAARLRRCRNLLEAGLLDVLSQSSISNTALGQLSAVISRPGTCVITTNYDMVPELALKDSKVSLATIDYGMAWRDPRTGLLHQRPSAPAFSLFKLHGSVNWLACPSCEHVYVNEHADVALLDTDSDTNEFGDATTCHCGYAPLRRMIVSPSLSRGAYQTQLRNMQLAALEAARESDEIFIVGYSLPMEDLFIRSLFLRSVTNHSRPKVVRVYQRSDEAQDRYNMLFSSINGYEYHPTGFDGFIEFCSSRQ